MDQEQKKWNQLATQQDEIYHLCAKRSGLPDAQFWLLYAICETEDVLCQNAFCESWCYSKQTASAAVAALEKTELVHAALTVGMSLSAFLTRMPNSSQQVFRRSAYTFSDSL